MYRRHGTTHDPALIERKVVGTFAPAGGEARRLAEAGWRLRAREDGEDQQRRQVEERLLQSRERMSDLGLDRDADEPADEDEDERRDASPFAPRARGWGSYP